MTAKNKYNKQAVQKKLLEAGRNQSSTNGNSNSSPAFLNTQSEIMKAHYSLLDRIRNGQLKGSHWDDTPPVGATAQEVE